MRRNRIRLSEGQLRRVIKESVKRILRETHDIPAGYDDYEYFEDDGTGGRTAIGEPEPEINGMSDGDYEDYKRQQEIDSDWNDIEAADADFDDYDLNIDMKNFDLKNNPNIHDLPFKRLGIEAQDPSINGSFARNIRDYFTKHHNDDLNTNGLAHRFKKHNIQDDFWNKPDNYWDN